MAKSIISALAVGVAFGLVVLHPGPAAALFCLAFALGVRK